MKSYAKYLPYIVFFVTLFLGVITIFFAYLLSNPPGETSVEISAKEAEPVIKQPVSLSEVEETAPIDRLPGNIDESVFAEFEPKPPVCLSFLSATESEVDEDGQYPPNAVFDFSVAAYDPNAEDKINKIEFKFYTKEPEELADTVECVAGEEGPAECTGTSYKDDLDLEREVFQANIKGYSFPYSGDFKVSAIVYSTDGSSVDCQPANGSIVE